MSEDFNNWNKDEFLAFVLIKAAFADRLIQEDEKKIITDILPIDRFYQLLEFYRKNMESENDNVYKRLIGKFYKTEKDNNELRYKIRSLFLSDGQFSWVEKDFEEAFEKLFG
jgi:hypothetical protein